MEDESKRSKIKYCTFQAEQIFTVKFHFGNHSLSLVDKYKYLEVYLDEHMTFDYCASVLSEAGGRALRGIINKFRTLKDVGLGTFEKLYYSGVVSITDCSGNLGV